MNGAPEIQPVLLCGELAPRALERLFVEWGLRVSWVSPGAGIPGSYWQAPEAGIVGDELFVRGDTPVHSALHEGCHLICAGAARRSVLDTDARSDELEEDAVCYLQILLAARLEGVGSDRIQRDMDTWGYSFRLGSAARWFAEDAEDARAWLENKGLTTADRIERCEGENAARPSQESAAGLKLR